MSAELTPDAGKRLCKFTSISHSMVSQAKVSDDGVLSVEVDRCEDNRDLNGEYEANFPHPAKTQFYSSEVAPNCDGECVIF